MGGNNENDIVASPESVPIHRKMFVLAVSFTGQTTVVEWYSRLSLSRSRLDPLKHFEISVLRHIRCAELRKIPNEQPNFTNEHVI